MKVKTPDLEGTVSFGRQLGSALRGGEIIELIGDVGAGKTVLTKGIAKGLDIDEDVQSPTFTLNRIYETPDGRRLSHYDFYRLHDAGILRAELEETIHDPETITVIEWADIVESVLPDDRLTIRIAAETEQSRLLTVDAGGPKSRDVLERLKA